MLHYIPMCHPEREASADFAPSNDTVECKRVAEGSYWDAEQLLVWSLIQSKSREKKQNQQLFCTDRNRSFPNSRRLSRACANIAPYYFSLAKHPAVALKLAFQIAVEERVHFDVEVGFLIQDAVHRFADRQLHAVLF